MMKYAADRVVTSQDAHVLEADFLYREFLSRLWVSQCLVSFGSRGLRHFRANCKSRIIAGWMRMGCIYKDLILWKRR